MDNHINYITTCGKHLDEIPTPCGPLSRDVYILHYVAEGKGFLDFGNKHIHIKKGQSFLIRPYIFAHYYPDPSDPWRYIWVNFRGAEFENLINKIRFINSNCVIDYTNPKYTFDYYSIICDEFF